MHAYAHIADPHCTAETNTILKKKGYFNNPGRDGGGLSQVNGSGNT